MPDSCIKDVCMA